MVGEGVLWGVRWVLVGVAKRLGEWGSGGWVGVVVVVGGCYGWGWGRCV